MVTKPQIIEPGELPKQFLLTREKIVPPETWQTLKLGNYYLYCAAGLPITRVLQQGKAATDKTDTVSSLILGWFGYENTFFPNDSGSRLVLREPIEEAYPYMTGRFVLLNIEDNSVYCTTDAGAQFPVVYRAATSEVASTPGLFAWTQAIEPSETTSTAFERFDGARWMPFGATPYAGIRRLLPRRRLQLGSNGCKLTEWNPCLDVKLDVGGLVSNTSRFIQSLIDTQRSVECHLTAGWDSRMVLAASWPNRASIQYLTYQAPGTNAKIDNTVARAIAHRFSLAHASIEVHKPDSEEVAQWMARTSYCIQDSVINLSKTVESTYRGRFGLAGVGGEVGRAFYWNQRDIGRCGIEPAQLLHRLGFKPSGIGLERAENWLAGSAHLSTSRILDQAYIDLRLGCWSGPSMCGHRVEKPTLSPFNSHAVYESMMRLPEEYRLSGQFARDFIAQATPELSRLPVNRLWGIQRLVGLPREFAKKLPKTMKTQIREGITKRLAA